MTEQEKALAKELIVRRESLKETAKMVKSQLTDVERQLTQLVNANGSFPLILADGRNFNISLSNMTREVPKMSGIKNERPDIWEVIRNSFMSITRYKRLNVRRIISTEE